MDELQLILQKMLNEQLTQIILSNSLDAEKAAKVKIRPVCIKDRLLFQETLYRGTQVFHDNFTAEEVLSRIMEYMQGLFKQGEFKSPSLEATVLVSKKGKITVKSRKKSVANMDGAAFDKKAVLSHNRSKQYILQDGQPVDFLVGLGVQSPDGKVTKARYDKFRQINRYLEIVEDVFPYLPADKEKPLKIIDFGCGKAYLTFAIYYYLKVQKNRNVEIIGLDLKKDVIDFCNKVARELGYHELKFLMGDIADYTSDHADMVVTLHACDTATDYALMNAESWNTKVILSVPCCQHELFSQIKNEIHQPMLKYGILKDRLTEYLTDGLRGLKLESKGYDVAMIEFTSLEHTARNIMIKAVKTGNEKSQRARKAQAQYEALRDFYQVKPTIEKL